MMFNSLNLKVGILPLVLTALMFAVAPNANAHQVWLERDADIVRIYLGEPGIPDTGDKIENLKSAQVFTDSRETLAVLNQKNDHWQGIVGQGDVRLFSDKVWQPWRISDKTSWWKFWDDQPEKFQGAILQARAGRTETDAKLTYELVPTTPNGSVFVALFKGAPLAEQDIILLSPSKKEVKLTTDTNGAVDISSLLTERGRYVMKSVHTIEVDAVHSGKKVNSLMYISTLSFLSSDS